MLKYKEKEKNGMLSFTANMTKGVISLATSLHGVGPRIQDGTFRKKAGEIDAPWHCPKDFSLVPIKMPNFSMELLAPRKEERIRPEREVILQLHGGGYIGKIRNAYRDFAVLYGKMEGERAVLSPDYRVAPEDPYPAALEDALMAYRWLLEMGCGAEQIIVAGDSAGGGLALALAMYLKDHGDPLPKKLVLMSPWTDLTASGESYHTNFHTDPLFGNTMDSMIYSNAYYKGYSPQNPYISPLFGDFTGLPPMLFQVGGTEMLLSDSVEAAKKADRAGCDVRLTVYEGMFHVFQLGMKKMKESREAWEEVEAFLNSEK
ncbi:MAG: alpha/beta hydrolase [Lachnospiraceae bacterium]|nr:alpha/beta hydrolase [Lachnospiraceae bacterium]MDY5497557.1 alpha/beta hydrolase [Anaerobutyricum sp.]